MSFFVNLIRSRLLALDFTNPLTYFDFVLALFLIVGFLVYIRKFPLFRVVLGIIFLLALVLIFFIAGFIFTALVIGLASGLILFSLPLIVAPEIRHYLEKLGRFPFLKVLKVSEDGKNRSFIRNLTDAVFDLAGHKIGAIIVIQRKTGLGATIETGVIINAKFSSKLLQSIFFKDSPLHDGAVVIHDGKIFAAACLLPIDSDVKLDPPFGIRHKSGLAITRDTDAVSLIISEQRGEVSLAENGKFYPNLGRAQVLEKLTQLL